MGDPGDPTVTRQRIELLDEVIQANWDHAEKNGMNQLTAVTLLRFYQLRDRLLGQHRTVQVEEPDG